MRADEQHRMVLQVLSDARQVGAHRRSRATAVRRRTDPGAQQQRRRLDAAAAQDDFARAELARPAPATVAFTPTARLPSNTISEAVACCRIVRFWRARTSRIEIAERRRRAALRRIAHRQRAIAVAEVAVHVGDHRHLAARRRTHARRARAASSSRGRRGGSVSVRRARAARRRSRDRSRACGSRAARRSRPSRARRAHSIRRSRPACRAARPFPSRSSRRR